MRSSRSHRILVLACFVIAFLAATRPGQARAAWPTTAATRCWAGGEGEFVKMRIIPVGSGFFSIHSASIWRHGQIKNVSTGTAHLRGNTVYFTLTGAGYDTGDAWYTQSLASFNRSTLAGQFQYLTHFRNPDGSVTTTHGEGTGTLTPVSCSSIWQ